MTTVEILTKLQKNRDAIASGDVSPNAVGMDGLLDEAICEIKKLVAASARHMITEVEQQNEINRLKTIEDTHIALLEKLMERNE